MFLMLPLFFLRLCVSFIFVCKDDGGPLTLELLFVWLMSWFFVIMSNSTIYQQINKENMYKKIIFIWLCWPSLHEESGKSWDSFKYYCFVFFLSFICFITFFFVTRIKVRNKFVKTFYRCFLLGLENKGSKNVHLITQDH